MKVVFDISGKLFKAEFNDSKTAKDILDNLPVESSVLTWGEEIYFEIPVKCAAENATMDVGLGTVAYWPPGQCLCIFFGRTPDSKDDKPKPASKVNIVGNIEGVFSELKSIKPGQKIIVSKA
ncbi:MAG: hypothetical protein C4533_05975 [Candidatus Omnitrophota bacterium]|jgi:hypothetical protein|nr:MAG: hypothetical protein C4533_05975 [Candidatus Omnitrophota bacterium]